MDTNKPIDVSHLIKEGGKDWRWKDDKCIACGRYRGDTHTAECQFKPKKQVTMPKKYSERQYMIDMLSLASNNDHIIISKKITSIDDEQDVRHYYSRYRTDWVRNFKSPVEAMNSVASRKRLSAIHLKDTTLSPDEIADRLQNIDMEDESSLELIKDLLQFDANATNIKLYMFAFAHRLYSKKTDEELRGMFNKLKLKEML